MSLPHSAPSHGPDWDRLERASLIAAAAGAGCLVLFALTPLAGPHGLTQAAVSYLVGFHYWMAVPLGCLVVLMIQYLTGGAWGVLLRPLLETGSRTLGMVAVLFVPVAAMFLLGDRSPFPWARPLASVASGEALEELKARTWLLNPSFVLARAALYFGFWWAIGHFLRAWSVRWRDGDARAGKRLPAFSGPGLIVHAVVVTFAAIDWVMSLEPFWRSTVYPPLYAIGQIITIFAFAITGVILLSPYPPLAGRLQPKLLRDLGGLLLTFVMLWAYLAFSQFILIWVGNLPEEAPYYLKRMRGGWQWIGLGLITLHFAVPFVLLLFRGIKENPRSLLRVTALVLIMRFVDVFWWIEPAFPHRGFALFWLMDFSAFVAIGGAWMWSLIRSLRVASLVPLHGPTECGAGGAHG